MAIENFVRGTHRLRYQHVYEIPNNMYYGFLRAVHASSARRPPYQARARIHTKGNELKIGYKIWYPREMLH